VQAGVTLLDWGSLHHVGHIGTRALASASCTTFAGRSVLIPTILNRRERGDNNSSGSYAADANGGLELHRGAD
jgi:hypothetical protein